MTKIEKPECIKKACTLWTAIAFTITVIFPGGAFGLTARDEEKLSREFLKVVTKHYTVIKDPYIINYINKVGQQIVSVLPDQPFKYQFYIVKDDVYNAFAGPAGHIFINSGLFEAMESEGELAGILGHEISHVACRHISGMAERSKKIGMATLAGIALGIFMGIGGGGEAASAMAMGSIAAGKSVSLAYSRENEMQADQIGLKYLNAAGYSGKDLLSMLRKIRNKSWFGSEQIPTYLNTHPANEERMSYIGTWVDNHEKKSKKFSRKSSSEFHMIHTRLVAMYGEKDIALKKFETNVKNKPDDPMANYGYGLILARTGNLKEAIIRLKGVLEKKAFNPIILKDLGRIYFLNGQFKESLQILGSNQDITLDDPERSFLIGRCLIMLGRYNEAIYTLEKLIKEDPDYPEALLFISEPYHKLGRHGESSYYLGLYYKNKGELRNAQFHLKMALEKLDDQGKKDKIKKLLKSIDKRIARSHEPSD
jgi:predicted Zn-dependent protease